MKILKLTFENINSLKGKWQIDFEDPAFQNHALFTITGPTGAGKTTILDAICLALYGETPRLNISPTQNELMSIGTAFTSSTVIFRANGQIYQASWSQRRANQKSDGRLQAVSREISELGYVDDPNGKIIEEKASLVNKRIEQILGMNKTQFTRSVMLVQGEFAAFLRSDAAERGQILEQITGTQIYAEISQAAYKKHKQQNNLLKELQLKLGEVQLLSQEEYQALLDRIALISDKKTQTETELGQTNAKLKLANQYASLTQEISAWQDKIKKNQRDIDDMSEDLMRLDKAKHAALIAPLYQSSKALYDQHQQKMDEKRAISHKLDALEIRVDDQQSQQQNLQSNLHQKNQEFDAIKPKIQAARKLDMQIHSALTEKAHLAQTLQKTRHELSDSQQSLKSLQSEARCIQDKIDKINLTISPSHLDDLTDKYQASQQGLSRFDALSQSLIHAHHQYLSNVHQLKNALIELATLRDNFKRLKSAASTKQAEIDSHYDQFYHLLKINNKEHESYTELMEHMKRVQEKIKTANHTLKLLEQIKGHAERRQPLLDEATALSAQKIKLDADRATIDVELLTLQEKIDQTEQNHGTQAENLALQTQLLHLKAHLENLDDGEPCPLCGSTEHPYKHTDGSINDNTDNAKTKLTAIENQLSELKLNFENKKSALHTLLIAIENNAYKLDNLHNNIQSIDQQMRDLWPTIQDRFVDYDDPPSQPIVDDLINQTLQDIRALEQVFHDGGALIAEIQDTHNSLDKIHYEMQSMQAAGTKASQDAKSILIRVYHEGHHLKQNLVMPMIDLLDTAAIDGAEHLQSHLQMISHELLDLSTVVAQIEQNPALAHKNLPKSEDITPPAEFDGAIIAKTHQTMQQVSDILKSQIDSAKAQFDAITNLNTTLTQLATQIDVHQVKIQTLTPDVDGQIHAIETKSAEISSLNAERTLLIDAPDIDALEHSHQSQISDLREKVEQHRAKLQEDFAQLQAQKAKMVSLIALIHETDTKLKHDQAAYQDALERSIFEDEAQFLAASLPKDEIDALQFTADQLHAAIKQNQISLKNSQNKLDELLDVDASVSDLDIEMLQLELIQLQNEWTSIHQRIGEMNAAKANEIKSRERQAVLLADIEKQHQESDIWAQLNALIGSENGNKYRNFVQGLTLDLVLKHANQILSKMSDRYLLTVDADGGKSLEILVTDLHQGDAVRSSKNLSGGESFIISLALALGLSQINSKNVHIESLFLDEGFGTLDEAALDLALTTLFELQQSGKSIGIISHVASLKERIDTQITVQKHAGGHSVLHGAGVRRLA